MSDADRDLVAKLRTIRINRRAFLRAAATTAAGAAIAGRAGATTTQPRTERHFRHRPNS